MPAFVLHKGIVSPKIHRHRLSTVRAVWDEFCWNPHIFLLLYHLTDELFIIISFLTARLAALKKSIVPLCIKQSFLIKSCLLETVIYIRCQHKIVLVPHQFQQLLIHRFRCIHVTVDIDITAPVRPVFFQRLIRIKTAGIHIREIIFRRKI